jgi:hypothetical protein
MPSFKHKHTQGTHTRIRTHPATITTTTAGAGLPSLTRKLEKSGAKFDFSLKGKRAGATITSELIDKELREVFACLVLCGQHVVF